MRTVRRTRDGMVRALLQGGPHDIPSDQRECDAPADCHKIKIVHRGGYEHFEREPESAAEPIVFRWTARTRMAE